MMNPRRPSRFSARAGSGGRAHAARAARGGPKPPMLLGEPSPGLAKINSMSTSKLQDKIASLDAEHALLETRLTRLRALDPQPTEKITTIEKLQERLVALRTVATERLKGKLERKALREQRGF